MHRILIFLTGLFIIYSGYVQIASGADKQEGQVIQSNSSHPSMTNTTRQEIDILQTVFPNPFTPNKDGYNDYVEFILSETTQQKPVIRIFNLRGKKVRELNAYAGNACRWDGKDEFGKNMEPGVYIYFINLEDKQDANGTITLIR